MLKILLDPDFLILMSPTIMMAIFLLWRHLRPKRNLVAQVHHEARKSEEPAPNWGRREPEVSTKAAHVPKAQTMDDIRSEAADSLDPKPAVDTGAFKSRRQEPTLRKPAANASAEENEPVLSRDA
jgi:hypothetical protein